MSRPSNDDRFPDILEAWEAALAEGDATRCERILAEFPEIAERLRDNRDCLLVLQQLRSGSRIPDEPETAGSLWDNPTPLETSPVTRDRGPTVDRLGRFEIRRELGRGGCGVVYVAWDPQLEREVALKVPRAELLTSGTGRKRFAREARAAARLDHPNVAAVFESGAIGPLVYLATTYCPGPNLSQWHRDHGEPVPWRDAITIVLLLAEAVEHAHARGVLHRDLKPANVVMVRVEDTNSPPPGSCRLTSGCFVPRLTDFGLARIYSDAASETQDASVLGTPAYMAPEQASGDRSSCTYTADVYSLGAILYQLLTGEPPFDGASPLEVLDRVRHQSVVPLRERRPDLPADAETVCLECLEKEPAQRYARAEELAADLRRLLDGQPVRARRISRVERFWRACRRQPAVTALVTSLLVILAAGGLFAWSWHRTLDDHLQQLEGQQQAVQRLEKAKRQAEQVSGEDLQLMRREAQLQISQLAKEAKQIGSERQVELARQGAELLRRCRQRDDQFASWQTDAGHGFLFAGQLLAGTGRLDEAGQCLRDAAALLQPQGDDDLENAVIQRALVQVDLAQADVEQWTRGPNEALDQYLRAEELSSDLMRKHGDFVLDQIAYSQALLGQVRMLRRLDQRDAARALVDRQIRDTAWAIRPSFQRPPITAIHGEWLKLASDWRVGPLETQSKGPLALGLAIEVSVRGRAQLAAGHDERGWLLVRGGQLAQAEKEFALAQAIHGPMENVTMPDYQLCAARHHRYRARWWQAKGAPAQALAELENAARRLQPLTVTRPAWLPLRHEAYLVQRGIVRLNTQLESEDLPELDKGLATQRSLLQLGFPEVPGPWSEESKGEQTALDMVDGD